MKEFYPIVIALIFNATDIVTGIIGGVKQTGLDSSALRDGLFKKVGFIFCYFIAWVVDSYGYLVGFNFGIELLPVIILYTCSTELVSVIENIHKINPDLLPEKLMELFHINRN